MAIDPELHRRHEKTVLRTDGSARIAWARWANWVVGISAGVFLLISLGGYLYHRGQLADIVAEHLRLVVTGPARLHAGVSQRYTVRTTTVTGRPVPAHVEFTMAGPDGRLMMSHKEAVDERGTVEIAVLADEPWPAEVRMEVVGTYLTRTERMEGRLAVEPEGSMTALCLDRSCYRPGERLRYRSMTVSRVSLAAARPLPVRFEVRAPDGSRLADSVREGETVRGAGWGEYLLPADLADGVYTLVATSPKSDFPQVRREFTVRRDLAVGLEKAAKNRPDVAQPPPAVLKGPAQPTSAVLKGPTQSPSGALQDPAQPRATVPRAENRGSRVSFQPEGGELVAGLENRVYVSACDGSGRPTRIAGRVVDGQGRAVAIVETSQDGMGSFQFIPEAAEPYRIKVGTAAESVSDAALPDVSGNRGVVLAIGLGVLEPGAPLEFNLRASTAGVPLVAVVWCRGIQVGEQMLISAVGANSVAIPLNEEAAGTLRLAVYEYRSNPPKRIAERLVYRRPTRRLDVQAVAAEKSVRPGEAGEIAIRVADEQGKPRPTALSIAVASPTKCPEAAAGPVSTTSQFLLLGELDRPETIDNPGSYLARSDGTARALDLLLGTHVRRARTVAEGVSGGQAARADATEAACPGCDPPMMSDNLSGLLERFQDSLTSYRENRTRVLNTLTTLSFFGGIGLVVFVAMLSLLNIPCGLRLWGPSLVVAAACVVIGAVLMDPERLKPSREETVPFASLDAPPVRESLRRETASKRLPPFGDASPRAGGSPDSETPLWCPSLMSDDQGRASVPIRWPGKAATYRILVDAHAEDGRIGALRGEVNCGSPSPGGPGAPANGPEKKP